MSQIAPRGPSMQVNVVSDTVSTALLRLGPAFVGEKLELALVAGTLLIQNDARRRAPDVSDRLMHSIHIGGHTELAPGFSEAEGYSDIGGRETGPASARILVGTNIPYGRRIEYGFVGTDSLGRKFHQTPEPYLRPAFHENADKVRAVVGLALDELLAVALA